MQTDVLVIGGGATGVGVAWDAALRGYDVTLVERGDLAEGTSGRFPRQLHTGGPDGVKDPQAAEEYRDRGKIYLDLECFRAALADFRSYLFLNPEAGDADEIKGKTMELQQLAARLN